MPWGRIDDRLAMSVKIRGLADPGVIGLRAKRQRAEALGVWTQVLSWVSGERSDGFVTADILELFGWPEANARLLRARYGRAPLLHARADGESCPCMDGRSWVDDFEYLIHDYLDRNPSRSENDVHRAKQRELRDAKLKLAARQRDRDRCRYCGKECKFSDRSSDDGLTYDHVDPEVSNGLDNLVVACRGCNKRKARRTPEQAGMTLIPLADLLQPTYDGPVTRPATEPATVAGFVTGPVAGPAPAPDQPHAADQGRSLPPDLRPDAASSQHHISPGRDGEGTGTAHGPAPPHQTQSARPAIGPPDTPRGNRSTSPYLRGQRPAPEHHAGHPPHAWPPGSVPADVHRPPDDEEVHHARDP